MINVLVRVSSVLVQYTKGLKKLNISGSTVREIIEKMEVDYPGIKFRFINELEKIRPHMNLFVNKNQIKSIDTSVTDSDELFITQALSGG